MKPDDPRWEEFPDFNPSEFACGCGCGISNPTYQLLVQLQAVRKKVKHPLIITSGSRCMKHNNNIGGVDSSAHIASDFIESTAADISARGSSQRYGIIKAALTANKFNRIGIDKSFIHLDVDPTKPPNVLWLY